ncbi:MAG: T9SS type A sorting domain-containing protein [Bacteroidetes bacterium]|nr:T9SS type A sorting domain-containing protein [Bacteroidota bacterium]
MLLINGLIVNFMKLLKVLLVKHFIRKKNAYFALIVTQNGCTDTSDCFFMQIESILSSNKTNIVLTPNPATDFILLEFDATIHPQTIVTYDMHGSEIPVTFNNNYEANIQTIAPGLYFSKINLPNESYIIKWIKN